MAISELSGKWHGMPLYVWYGGAGLVGGAATIFLKRYRAAKAAAGSTTSPVANASGGFGSPLPGWSGLGDALGPLGGSSPTGPLLGYTSDGTPVYGKSPEVTGLPTPTGNTAGILPGENPSVLPSLDAIPSPTNWLQPVSAPIMERILPSLETPTPPMPQPATVAPSVTATPQAVAGMPAGSPGITQVSGGYTVPTNWLDPHDIKTALAYDQPTDLSSGWWNAGKPSQAEFDAEPVWKQMGFGSEAQYQDATNPNSNAQRVLKDYNENLANWEGNAFMMQQIRDSFNIARQNNGEEFAGILNGPLFADIRRRLGI